MARPKKNKDGEIPVTRKRGNPDFQVSSYYIPKKLNLKFDRAMLTLRAANFDVDRSDVLTSLIARFVEAVDVAERQMEDDGGLDLNAVLEEAGSGSVTDSAGMTLLKAQLKTALDAAQVSAQKIQEISQRKDALTDELVSLLVGLIPEENRAQAMDALKVSQEE